MSHYGNEWITSVLLLPQPPMSLEKRVRQRRCQSVLGATLPDIAESVRYPQEILQIHPECKCER